MSEITPPWNGIEGRRSRGLGCETPGPAELAARILRVRALIPLCSLIVDHRVFLNNEDRHIKELWPRGEFNSILCLRSRRHTDRRRARWEGIVSWWCQGSRSIPRGWGIRRNVFHIVPNAPLCEAVSGTKHKDPHRKQSGGRKNKKGRKKGLYPGGVRVSLE